MILVSCITKFHSFNLAEQLDRQNKLTKLYSSYSYVKNTWARSFTHRIDKEVIRPELIHTNIAIAAGLKIYKNPIIWNNQFDKWVSKNIQLEKNAKVFIGWSGMSLESIKKAKLLGLKTILERGSAHIENQVEILEEEYLTFGKKFPRSQAIIDKELEEYELVDIISVPSIFAANSFYQKGVPREKIWINNFGSSTHFQILDNAFPETKPFRILYLGGITIQKGIKYLLDAMDTLEEDAYELWLIGTVANELKPYLEKRRKKNWKIYGFINHYELPQLISQCHIAIQPSLQEGLSMVIPQILACGLPVVATTNSGGEDVIQQNKNGFIIPVRNAQAIRDKILFYRNNIALLKNLRLDVKDQPSQNRSWDDYGIDYLKKISSHFELPLS